MMYAEIERLFDEIQEADMEYAMDGGERPAGIWMKYENKEGNIHTFLLRNPEYSHEYRNCIEGDCFSEYQYENLQNMGIDQPDFATTSHRTFNISQILQARVEYE